MVPLPAHLLARPCPDQPLLRPVAAPPLFVALASLARGGAERIVLDWLQHADAKGQPVVLGVLHQVAAEWSVPPGITVLRSGAAGAPALIDQLAQRAKAAQRPVFTHLVRDDALARFWALGVSTIPTVHNARAGWCNDPRQWPVPLVPTVLAVSESVAADLRHVGVRAPVVVIRHQPTVSTRAIDPERRAQLRAHYGVHQDELLVGMVGSIKPQKNYEMAFRVVTALKARRRVKLLIAGGCNGPRDRAYLRELCQLGSQLRLTGTVLLPGFVSVPDHLAAFDVMLNTSHYEGLSIALQEGLLAAVPALATAVGGQVELAQPGLTLVPLEAEEELLALLATMPVRQHLPANLPRRTPTQRLWSCAAVIPTARPTADRVLFITANLNAGGAQRSLVNLAVALEGRVPVSVAVCNPSTHAYFGDTLQQAKVAVWRPTASNDVLLQAEALLAAISAERIATVCFWNVDPRLKLVLAKFLGHVRVIDVSPGHYAFLEMAREAPFGQAMAMTPTQYYGALSALVLKYQTARRHLPPEVSCPVHVIPNGVAILPAQSPLGDRPRVVISGRLAASKQWPLVMEAVQLARREMDFEVHVWGQVEPREAEAFAPLYAQVGHDAHWHFHGAAPDHIANLGEYHLALVLGTHQGCPNSVLEALAAGVPVLANASGGTAELVRDGHNGILLSEHPTAQEVAAGLVRALPLAAAWRTAARASVQEYSVAVMAQAFLHLFTSEVNDVERIAA